MASSRSSSRHTSSSSDDFVIALTPPDVPLMPNGIAVDRHPRRWPSPDAGVRCGKASVDVGALHVDWSATDPPTWDPTARAESSWPDAAALRERGSAILRACGIRPEARPAALSAALAATDTGLTRESGGRRGVAALLSAVHDRDPLRARAAADVLLGRGQGLTPEGDDFLAGTAATVARCASAAQLDAQTRSAWLDAVCPPHTTSRTSTLSATLLRLAVAGQVVEPADRVLDPRERDWPAALRSLLGVGSSTGRAYGVAIGATALLLSEPSAAG
jgi:hypothetical protein